MALSGNYTTLADIIERIYRKYGFSEIHEEEAAEWTWDIMGKIGVPGIYFDDIVTIKIAGFRGEIPKNYFNMEGGMIRDYNTQIPLTPITDIFHKFTDAENVTPTIAPQDWDPSTGIYFHTVIPTSNDPEYYTYAIKRGYITVGFETGTIQMAYKAFPVDEVYGLPLIPDNAKFIEAIVDYIALSLALRLYLQDKLSEKKYNLIERNSVYSAGAARNKALIPNLAEMETLRNRWMSSLPYYEHWETGFKHLGKRY